MGELKRTERTVIRIMAILLAAAMVPYFGVTERADTMLSADAAVNSDRTAEFQYQGDSSTVSVHVAGDMNGWSTTAMPMVKDENNVWSVTTKPLSPGKHEYKFVVNGSDWITDPSNPQKSDNGNSLIYVPGFYAINGPGQVEQGKTANFTAAGLKADGTDETLSGVSWSVSPESAASINQDGVLTAKSLPNGTDSVPVTITGQKDGITVTKEMTIVQALSEQPGGKEVVLVGDIQAAAGASAWAPADPKTRMLYQGNGLYKITLKNVPAGNYQYKVALGGSWAENYGANGARDGSNIPLSVPKEEDVTFYYSDITHNIADSTTYTAASPVLTGTGISATTKLEDYTLTGVYSAKITLPKGTYSDLVITDESKTFKVNPFTISEDSKDVTISYDEATGIVFNDLSSKKIDTASLYFNSKDAAFKSLYGAVPSGKKVSFSLQSKKGDLTEAKLVVLSGMGAQVLDMQKNSAISNDQYDRWSVDFKADKVGLYQYYFAVTNGSDVKAYGDDDGYYGPGKAGDIGKVGKYDMTVYDKNFKTPDWMKNAVVYQIFPDRFFNGDTSNDYAQKLARGATPFEFIKKWNSIPEDPTIEFKRDADGNIVKDASGNPVIDPNYKANIGDGIWNNDVFGGDLKGIQDKLTYLKSLGVNTLYLNPISEASSNHRYDTKQYQNVDPMLGHMDDFVNLVHAAHKMGMHLILDGVFNHVSDDSVYFDRYGKYVQAGKPIGAYQYWSRVYDLMNANSGLSQQDAEKQVQKDLKTKGITDFHYKDWFIVLNSKDDSGTYKYNGWNGDASLPEIQALNNSEYNVSSWAKEIIDGPNADSKYWLDKGVNGWRLDAADSVSDDTWQHFRPAVKGVNSDDVIVGEIWGDSSKYLLGNMFDSVMNYRFRGAVQEFVTGSADAEKAMNDLEKMREQYPKEAFNALMNIVDSHDTERIISDFDGIGNDKAVASNPSADALRKMKLVPFIQMTYPGAPTIYYGDELGMPGAGDPDDRRPMAWGKGNKELVEWYAALANIRNTYDVLRTGDIVPLQAKGSSEKDVLAYIRSSKSNHAVVAANRGTAAITGLQLAVSSIPNGTTLTNALNKKEKYTVQNGSVTVNVPAQSGIILVENFSPVHMNKAKLKEAYNPKFTVTDRFQVTGITMDSALTLKAGQKVTLKAKVTPKKATLKKIVWSSSNEQVAKVDQNGHITAIDAGTAVITAKTADGEYTKTCKVTVVNKKTTHQDKENHPEKRKDSK